MNNFEFYLDKKLVKRQSKDNELAKSLIKDGVERVEKMKELDINSFSKIIFENIYDALRDLLDALLSVEGYKSYSHEATISYLKNCGFEDSIIMQLDNFRYLRNSSKYYGKGISKDNADEIVNFYENYHEKLIKLIKSKIV